MNDSEFVALLQWAAPRLGLRFRGFKNVRRQVHRRVAARMRELGLVDEAAYRARLETDPAELEVLRRLCFVTISRFYRDRRLYDALGERLLPELAARAAARDDRTIRVWSAGCASGEEPYSVAMVWTYRVAPRFPSVGLTILATDFDETVLERARRGVYEKSSLSELPVALREAAFGDSCRLRDELRRLVTFAKADLRSFVPTMPIDLVLCRNVVFTYFDEAAQRAFLERVGSVVQSGAFLVIGSHEIASAATFASEARSITAHPDVPLVYVYVCTQ